MAAAACLRRGGSLLMRSTATLSPYSSTCRTFAAAAAAADKPVRLHPVALVDAHLALDIGKLVEEGKRRGAATGRGEGGEKGGGGAGGGGESKVGTVVAFMMPEPLAEQLRESDGLQLSKDKDYLYLGERSDKLSDYDHIGKVSVHSGFLSFVPLSAPPPPDDGLRMPPTIEDYVFLMPRPAADATWEAFVKITKEQPDKHSHHTFPFLYYAPLQLQAESVDVHVLGEGEVFTGLRISPA
eukprot:jgi/Chlat1/1881/Chrsp145S00115